MPPLGSKADSYINMLKSFHVGRGSGERQHYGYTEQWYLKLGKRYNDIDDSLAFVQYCAQRDDPM